MIDDKTRELVTTLRARGFKEEQTPRGSEKYHRLTHELYPGFFALEGQVERTRLWYYPTGTMQIFLEAALDFFLQDNVPSILERTGRPWPL